MPHRHAFTLVELLVVMAIIAILAGMLMPIVTMARKRAAVTNTMALMRKVETGLELYKGELDTYPYQKHAADQPFPQADNRLAWFLAHEMDDAERVDLEDDLQLVREAYLIGGEHRVLTDEVDPAVENGKDMRERHIEQHAMLASRSARERGMLAILAGNVEVMGIGADRALRMVSDPKSKGCAFDFIAGDLVQRDVLGESLVDAWSQPLIYNCPVVQGVLPFWGNTNIRGGQPSMAMDPVFYGMETTGRAIATSLAGDQRTTASAAYMHGFELWSAGPDGVVNHERTNAANRDNVSPTDYWKDLR